MRDLIYNHGFQWFVLPLGFVVVMLRLIRSGFDPQGGINKEPKA